MIAVHVYVQGGVAWIVGGSEGIHVKLEDGDSGETVYYRVEGAEVSVEISPEIVSLIEETVR